MRKLLVAVLLMVGSGWVAHAQPLGQKVHYFPQFAIGGGAATDFTIHNPNLEAISVEIHLFYEIQEGAGTQGLSPDCSETVDLRAGNTRTITFDGLTGDCLTQVARDGWARLDSDRNFQATLFYRIEGVGNVGVFSSQPTQLLNTFNIQNGASTGVALANPDDQQSAEVDFKVFDDEGVMRTEGTLNLAPGGHFAEFFNQPPFSASGSGVVQLTSSQAVVAVALRLDPSNGGFLLAGVPVVQPGLPIRAELNAVSPNIIGGLAANRAAQDVVGAIIGGGGIQGALQDKAGGISRNCATCENVVTDNFGTISGGVDNTAGFVATVGGGAENQATAPRATVGGGRDNRATGTSSTVAGGRSNLASDFRATVGGGAGNRAQNEHATVAGGLENQANGEFSVVGGGSSNQAEAFASTVAGGDRNIATGLGSTIAGGIINQATGTRSSVGGGEDNQATGTSSTVGGGRLNTASEFGATISGGRLNTASGQNSTIPGGQFNVAAGDYSFAAGRRAQSLHTGTFVWADSSITEFISTGPDQFLIKARGGVGIGTAEPQGALDVNGPIFQRGGQLHADYVFQEGYELQSIEEHARRMWREHHLPAVPARKLDEEGREVVDVGAHSRGILEELEIAHIYIEQLSVALKEQQRQIDELKVALAKKDD